VAAWGVRGPTLRYAGSAPRGEVITYPDGHVAINSGDAFERVVRDQLAFLTRHVPVGSASGEDSDV
jgi:hypothetical protein